MSLQRPWLQFRKQDQNCCPDLVVAVVGSYVEIYVVVYVWKSGASYGDASVLFCGKREVSHELLVTTITGPPKVFEYHDSFF